MKIDVEKKYQADLKQKRMALGVIFINVCKSNSLYSQKVRNYVL